MKVPLIAFASGKPIYPQSPFVKSAKFGVLNILNPSALNAKLTFSVILEFLANAVSNSIVAGPHSDVRPTLP